MKKKYFAFTLFFFAMCLAAEYSIAQAQDSTNARRHTETEGKTYRVRAWVKKIFREEKKIMLKHEQIKGVMPAMTMTFPVSDPSILDEVKTGTRRTFTILLYKGLPTVIGVKPLSKKKR